MEPVFRGAFASSVNKKTSNRTDQIKAAQMTRVQQEGLISPHMYLLFFETENNQASPLPAVR